jgi:hydroxyethylthiazole kinase
MAMANIPEIAGQILEMARSSRPYVVHCIVGGSAERFVADTLRAAGATPTFSHDIREVADFVDTSRAVLVQLCTQSEAKENGVLTAIDTARGSGKPWILNPRAANHSIFRRERARKLSENKPNVIVGRPKELASILRANRVDPQKLAAAMKTTVVEIANLPIIACSFRSVKVDISCELWDMVDTMDSALAAMCAAFAGLEPDGHRAACAATLVTRVAARRAASYATGPGTFAVHFLDEIATLSKDDILDQSDVVELF